MNRVKTSSRQHVFESYWRAVKVQDEFWRGTFVDFVEPLRSLYKDPVSAGAHLLSKYLANPREAERIFKSTPDAFGTLLIRAVRSDVHRIYGDLLVGRQGVPLTSCARGFNDARAASVDLERLAAEQPTIYQELQKERALRKSIGKTVYVDRQQRARGARQYKISLRPRTKK
jgi:hypothetical protein